MDRKTLRKYTAPAREAGIEPGGPPLGEADWRALVTGWFPQLVDTRLRQVSWPGIEPHRDYIADQLKAGVTAATIHQRLRDEHGLAASGGERAPVDPGEPARGRPPCPGHRAARRPATRRGAGADRLRAAGDVARPGHRAPPHGVGVRDGAVLLAAHVRAPHPGHGSAGVDRGARGSVRVLRRRPGPAGAGQPEDRGGQARPLRPEDQPLVCGAGRALRHPHRPGPRGEAQGQTAGGTADALCSGLVLAGPGVRLARRRCAPAR